MFISFLNLRCSVLEASSGQFYFKINLSGNTMLFCQMIHIFLIELISMQCLTILIVKFVTQLINNFKLFMVSNFLNLNHFYKHLFDFDFMQKREIL